MRIAAAVILTLAFAPRARAEQKIAFISVQEVIDESAEGKAAQNQFKVDLDKLQGELEAKRLKLVALSDELEKQSAVLNPEVLEKRRTELQGKQRQFQEATLRSQQALKQQEAKDTQRLLERVKRATALVAEQDGYSVVFQREQVFQFAPADDITNQVIRKMNQGK